MYYATFNNISVISWWSVWLLEETRVSGENHQSAAINVRENRKELSRMDNPETLA